MHTKKDLEKQLQKRLAEKQIKVSQPEAATIATECLEAMKDCIYDKGLALVGFATFKQEFKEATTARHPRTGETINVPAKTVVKVKLADGLKKLK